MLFQTIIELFSRLMCVFGLHLSQSGFPRPLSPQAEQECFARASRGDSNARDTLIRHNLRLVAHIVKKYYAAHMDSDDLVSIGTIGLIKAVDSFRTDKSTRFATYASRCIENEILMTFRALRKEQNTFLLGDAAVSDSDGEPISLLELISDDSDLISDYEHAALKRRLSAAITELAPRERKIIELRYGLGACPPMTQAEVAAIMCISRSYVSRIEKAALKTMRLYLDEK